MLMEKKFFWTDFLKKYISYNMQGRSKNILFNQYEAREI